MAADTDTTGTSIDRATRSAVRCRVPGLDGGDGGVGHEMDVGPGDAVGVGGQDDGPVHLGQLRQPLRAELGVEEEPARADRQHVGPVAHHEQERPDWPAGRARGRRAAVGPAQPGPGRRPWPSSVAPPPPHGTRRPARLSAHAAAGSARRSRATWSAPGAPSGDAPVASATAWATDRTCTTSIPGGPSGHEAGHERVAEPDAAPPRPAGAGRGAPGGSRRPGPPRRTPPGRAARAGPVTAEASARASARSAAGSMHPDAADRRGEDVGAHRAARRRAARARPAAGPGVRRPRPGPSAGSGVSGAVRAVRACTSTSRARWPCMAGSTALPGRPGPAVAEQQPVGVGRPRSGRCRPSRRGRARRWGRTGAWWPAPVRRAWCRSPSTPSTVSTRCSRVRGPASVPSLVTCPTSTKGTRWDLARWTTMVGAGPHLGRRCPGSARRTPGSADGLDRVDDDQVGLRVAAPRAGTAPTGRSPSRTSRPGGSGPRRSARRRTWWADSSADTSSTRGAGRGHRPPAPGAAASTCPRPGSPPSRVTEPGTRPPPSTRSSSARPGRDRRRPRPGRRRTSGDGALGAVAAPVEAAGPTAAVAAERPADRLLDEGVPLAAGRAAPGPPGGATRRTPGTGAPTAVVPIAGTLRHGV